jgi:hypothetical protein
MKNQFFKVGSFFILYFLLIQNLSAQYCTGGGPQTTANSNIESVNITGENATSISYTGCPGVIGVEDQTTQSVRLNAGDTYTLEVKFGTCGSNFSGRGKAWIDFNQNQIFEYYESIGFSSGTPGTIIWVGSASLTFTVPITALEGPTRMRVMQQENANSYPNPCASFNSGSVIDFTANIDNLICAPELAPFYEGFNNGVLPTCWENLSSEVTTDLDAFWKFNHASNFAAAANGKTVGTYAMSDGAFPYADSVMLLTPFIDLSTLANPELTFEWFSNNAKYPGDNVPLIIEINDGTSWNYLDTLRGDNTAWVNEFYDLAAYAGDTIQVRFMVNQDFPLGPAFYNDILLDEITIDEKTTCLPVTNLAATNILGTTADLSWTEINSATTWNIEFGAPGFIQGSGTGTTISSVTSNPYTINVTPLTDYEFYVQSDCGGGDLSIWTGPFMFSSQCINVVAPWIEGFDNGGTIPTCWYQGVSNNGDWRFNDLNSLPPNNHVGSNGVINGSTASGGYFAWVDDSNLNSVATSLISPPIDVSGLTAPMLRFFLLSDREVASNVNFSVDIWDGAAWNIAMFTSNSNTLNNAWREIDVYMNTLTITGDIQVRFVVDEGLGISSRDDIAIDDVEIREAPSCLMPTNLTAPNYTLTSANLGWTENNSATSWNIEFGPAGFVQGSGAGTSISGVVTNPYTINTLAFTDYEFYVQSICSSTDESAWAGPFAFTTTCNGVLAPWVEDFENGGGRPECWYQDFYNNKDWNFDNVPPVYSHIGSNGVLIGNTASGGYFAWVDDSSPHSLGTTLFSPFIDISSLTVPMLRFFLLSDNEGDSNVNFSVDIWDGAAWNIGMFTSNSNTYNNAWQEIDILLTTLNITGKIRLRFVVDELNGNGSWDDVAIDDVEVREAPTCFKPTYLTASNIALNSTGLGWTENNSATNWNIEYGLAGFVQGSGAGTSATNVGTSPYIISTLGSTNYEFYIQSDCGGGDLSEWAGPFLFTTPCDSEIAPWSEDFSNNGYIPDCWEQGASNGEDWIFDDVAPFQTHIGNYGTMNGSTASGGYFAWVDDNPPHNIGTSLLSPMIDVSGLTIPMLSFYLISDNQGYTNVDFRVDVWDGANWNIGAFASSSNTNGGWEKFYVLLNTLNISGDIRLRFVVDEMNGSGFRDDIAIDDVSISEGTCNPASALGATNITASQADLSWTENNLATVWNVEYGITGFIQGNGTEESGVTNPYTLSGLDMNTTYDYYVQSDCGGGQSTWTGPFTFTTLCVSTTGTDTQLACENLTWIDGVTYTTNNNTSTYTLIGATATGCDSIVTLDLTIEEVNNAGSDNSITICKHQPLDLNTLLSSDADVGGIWLNPAGIPISGSTITSNVADVFEYSYQVSSLVCPINLAVFTIIVDEDCDYLSVDDLTMVELSVYPNPTSSDITILNPSNAQSLKVEISDMNGRIVLADREILKNSKEANLMIENLENGVYTLRVYNTEIQKSFKIVKK